MTHLPHPQMAAILRDMQANPAPDPQTMPIGAARALFAANAAQWNADMPGIPMERVILGGVACNAIRPHGARGVIVFVHGGGWTFGSPGSHDRFARLLAEEAGATVISPEYRLAPEHPCPAAIEDVLTVIAALDGLPGPLALCGDSAGANIALATALTRPARAPVALSLLYGCFAPIFDTASHLGLGDGRFGLTTEKMRWYWRNWQGAPADPRAAPLDGDLAGLPRTHLLAAGLDPLRDDTLLLAGRLATAGVPFRLDMVPGVIHGFLQMSARLAPARRALAGIGAELRAAIDDDNKGGNQA
ncbi:MAG: alpha/beta hydrolase [Rhodospirillales bacterium]|nr:alpha/beta hydrolase [Rhodospirillales bacterium]